MLEIKSNESQIAELEKELRGQARRIPGAMAQALNKTGTATMSFMAKQISSKINVTQKAIKQTKNNQDGPIRWGARASKDAIAGKVILKHTVRLPLRDFGAKQTALGVSYKISKGKSGFVRHAFQGPTVNKRHPTWNGRVFIRKNTDDPRSQIKQIFAVSAWGVYVKNKSKPATIEFAVERLEYEFGRVLRQIKLKKSGVIKSRKK